MNSMLGFNLVTLLSGFSFFSFILLIPLFTHELGMSLTETGITLAVFSVAVILFSPVWGYLSDRLGQRKLLLAFGNLLFFASSLLHAYVNTFDGLVILRFFQGIGFAASPMLTALFSDHFGSQAARRFGAFSAANAVGWGLGSLLSGILAETVGIRWVFLSVSFLPLVNAALIFWGLPEKSVSLLATEEPHEHPGVPSKLFYLYGMIFVRHSAAIALWSIFPIYLKSFVESLSMIGAINGLNMLVQPLFMLALGKYAERWDKLQLVLWGVGGSVVTFLVYALAASVWQIVVGQVMIAASWSAMFIGINLYMIEEVSPGSRGKAFGYLQSAFTSATSVGPVLGGTLSDSYGIHGMILIASLLMTLSLPFLLRLQAIEKRAPVKPSG
jgi:MFS family permease